MILYIFLNNRQYVVFMTDDDVLNALPITENIQLPSKGTLIHF